MGGVLRHFSKVSGSGVDLTSRNLCLRCNIMFGPCSVPAAELKSWPGSRRLRLLCHHQIRALQQQWGSHWDSSLAPSSSTPWALKWQQEGDSSGAKGIEEKKGKRQREREREERERERERDRRETRERRRDRERERKKEHNQIEREREI